MFEARFRSRATVESQESKHSTVIRNLSEIIDLWDTFPENIELSTSGESASCNLSPFLTAGLMGSINYAYRTSDTELKDRSIHDDILTITIDDSINNYPKFSGIIFEKIVKAFCAYRATIILDMSLDLDDYEEIVKAAQTTGKDVDGRDTIFRYNAINFFDEELCRRSISLSPQQIVDRLVGEVEKVKEIAGGVLIIATSDYIQGRENLEGVHNHIASFINA